MFDIQVFIVLLGIAVIANVVAAPKLIDFSTFYNNFRQLKMFRIAAVTQSLLISLVACLAGAYAAPRIGINTPFFSAIAELSIKDLSAVLSTQIMPALLLCVPVSLGAALLYSVFPRYRTIFQYFSMPLGVRVMHEGIVEEIVFRWGLLTIVAYIVNIKFIADRDTAIWVAICVSALASSLVHISDLVSFTPKNIFGKLTALMLVNFWSALWYGWLLFQYGLMAAIVCHAAVAVISGYANQLKSFFAEEESTSAI